MFGENCALIINVLVCAVGYFGLVSATTTAADTVLYIPLDERFTTRNAFLNLAGVTDQNVLTPPLSYISQHKRPANLSLIDGWIEQHAAAAVAVSSVVNLALVVSLEMYVYGGLIQSRISNTTQGEVDARLQQLVSLRERYPSMRTYVSAVVMRIPSYNGDFEEPWCVRSFMHNTVQRSTTFVCTSIACSVC